MSIYSFAAQSADGRNVSLAEYKGKVLLIVNVASACGFTPQYAGLERLYRTYKDRGLRILAFPCNDFGVQEPGTVEEIREFCSTRYGVTFDLFDKARILGDDKHPLYAWLTEHAEPAGDVKWNFEKFLIGRDGRLRARFASGVTPEDPGLAGAIESALDAR